MARAGKTLIHASADDGWGDIADVMVICADVIEYQAEPAIELRCHSPRNANTVDQVPTRL